MDFFRSRVWLGVVAFVGVWGASCVDEPVSSEGPDDAETGSGDGDGDPGDGDGDGDCVPGSDSCECTTDLGCDDGLTCVDGTCVGPGCGNGIVEDGEECDDANEDNSDHCLDSCLEATCGDGYAGPGEGCDDGNNTDDDNCTNECAPMTCGDGITQAAEQCDDQNDDNSDSCLDTCVHASCGDGQVLVGVEECDDQNDDDSDACLNACEAAICGDGVLHAGVEQCDDGNLQNTDGCVEGCVPASCGDGFIEDGAEACDDANNSNSDTCLQGCLVASCGDGHVGPGEGCDDGNQVDDDACDNMCTPASCGDGQLQMGEMCDDGNPNDEDGCLSTCALASCGDAHIYQGVEACDDGDADNTNGCVDTCEFATCGDGFVWVGQEECDDQNPDNIDDCVDTCEFASCGDGFLWVGQEECDDGNTDSTDACPNTCVPAGCGDGFVQAGIEACDQANDNPGDGCEPGCTRTPIIDLGSGWGHTCLVFQGGGLRCWGANTTGQLGLGHTNDIGDEPGEMPPPAVATGGMVVDVVLGEGHTCAILADGSLRCWGSGNYGKLGRGNITTIGNGPGEMPPPPILIGGPVVQVALGTYHTCALLEDGTVRCFGRGEYLGYGSSADVGDDPGEMPPPAVNLGGPVVEISVGTDHSCALLQSGEVRCWGKNSSGQLGIGSTERIGDEPGEMPPADTNVGAGVVAMLNAGGPSTCVSFEGGVIRCWGESILGQLGQPGPDIGDGPGEMPPANVNYGPGTPIFLGGGETRGVLLQDGAIRTWGIYGGYSYGSGSSIGDAPGDMPPDDADYGGSAILYGHDNMARHHCVVTPDWSLHCWGKGEHGQLGYGDELSLGDEFNPLPPPAVPTF